jgi:hydroxymethylpyrimidine pyrophosphatase-like HAD family hydrolase
MQLSNNSKKNLKEVFDMFVADDGGFTKTHIPVKNFFETYPVSRSQAKRLSNRFEAFQEIELDFEGIDEIGQGLIQQHETLDALLEQIKSEAATKYSSESTEIQNYINAQEAKKKAEEEKKKQEQSTQPKVYTV